MKKHILSSFFSLALTVGVQAQTAIQQPTFTEWHDLQVNDINRLTPHTSFFAYDSAEKALKGDKTSSNRYLSLDGPWRFKWVANADERPQDFFLPSLDDSQWATLNMPAIWELNGYGDPEYVNIGFAWRGHFESNPPEVPVRDNHVGSYRRVVNIPAQWKGKQVIAHFGSITSCAYLYLNGHFVGYSEDSKVAAEFDITPYVKEGDNLLAMQVFRWCDGSYCEDQDFWRLSGVARESYLYCRDRQLHIDDLRLTAQPNGDLTEGNLLVDATVQGKGYLLLRLQDKDGKVVATGMLNDKSLKMGTTATGARPSSPWSNRCSGRQRRLISIRSSSPWCPTARKNPRRSSCRRWASDGWRSRTDSCCSTTNPSSSRVPTVMRWILTGDMW